MKNHYIIKLKTVFLISFSMASYSFGANVENRIFNFEDKEISALSSEINYSRFAPVNQLNLKAMSVDLGEIIKNLEKKGYINRDTVSNSKRYEVLSYGLTTKKIYFFNNNSQTPDFFSEIYATNSKFNQLKSIRLGLSIEYNGKRFKKMNTDPIVPTSFISALNVIDERKSKEVYVSLMKQHILNIKNNVNEYCEFLVTTRVNVKDYWLELNTELTKNNTYFNIYQSKGIPQKCNL